MAENEPMRNIQILFAPWTAQPVRTREPGPK